MKPMAGIGARASVNCCDADGRRGQRRGDVGVLRLEDHAGEARGRGR